MNQEMLLQVKLENAELSQQVGSYKEIFNIVKRLKEEGFVILDLKVFDKDGDKL
jgi:orotidine-5'-phosphate decarboxylase